MDGSDSGIVVAVGTKVVRVRTALVQHHPGLPIFLQDLQGRSFFVGRHDAGKHAHDYLFEPPREKMSEGY